MGERTQRAPGPGGSEGDGYCSVEQRLDQARMHKKGVEGREPQAGGEEASRWQP